MVAHQRKVFAMGRKFRVLRDGARIGAVVPAGFGNALKCEFTGLPAGTVLYCLGVSDSMGDGVPIIKWADSDGRPFGLDAEFYPRTGDLWSSIPDANYLAALD